MMDPLIFFPSHVTELLSSLDSSESADRLLLSFHNKTISDPILDKIYRLLDFPNQRQIPSKRVKHLIENEYMQEFQPIDDYISKASEYTDEEPDPAYNIVKEDFFETNILSSPFSEETSSTPKKFSPSLKCRRSKNGLKSLSFKVKKILERLGTSTYQEVADYLVREEEDLKSEKNIRRRVYDALNVLVAVGVLKKNSKNIEPFRRTREDVQEKVRKLRKITDNYLRVRAVIVRNKFDDKPSQKIFLPFNVAAVPETGTRKVSLNFMQSGVVVKASQGIVLNNGEEILKKMNVSLDYSLLPEEVYCLCNYS